MVRSIISLTLVISGLLICLSSSFANEPEYLSSNPALAEAHFRGPHYDKHGYHILSCAVKMIELQIGGSESIIRGALILDRYGKLDPYHESSFKELLSDCKQVYSSLKNSKYLVHGAAVDRSAVFADLKSQNINIDIANHIVNRLNSKESCEFRGNMGMTFSAIVGATVGGGSASCKTPLGREFRYIGKFASIGFGLGVAVGWITGTFTLPVKSKKFRAIPFHSCGNFSLTGPNAHANARLDGIPLFGNVDDWGYLYLQRVEQHGNFSQLVRILAKIPKGK